jgi:hypothetical protein
MSQRVSGFILFLAISLAVRGLYIFLFHNCSSFDLNSWNRAGDILMAGGNPYNLTAVMNWPPFWMQCLFVFKIFSLTLHVPFDDVVRVFLIFAESLLALLLYITLVRYAKSASATKLLIYGIALNPISIFQVCQHCNFDVLVGFWILLAVYMLLRFQEHYEPGFWLCACFALGMGGLTKTIPLCLAPLLLISARKLKRTERFLGAVLLLGPAILGLSVLYVLGPQDIKTNVLDYRSEQGVFGFTGLFTYFGLTWMSSVWTRVFEIIYGALWIGLGIWLWSKEKLDSQKIILIAALLLAAIPAIGPGYGLQYVYWLLPLLLVVYGFGDKKLKFFLLISYAVAALIYTIEYAFNFNTFGAFFLEMVQTQPLLRFGSWISTPAHEMFLLLPLWVFYLISTVLFGVRIFGKRVEN